jgi:hypothetical protein
MVYLSYARYIPFIQQYSVWRGYGSMDGIASMDMEHPAG